MVQPVQYRNDAPPYIPNNIVCPPNMQYMLPVICAMIANEASQRCGVHPGRTFLFNQLSSNNWVNNDFCTVVSTVVDLLMLNMGKNLYRNIEEGVSSAVTDAMSIYASLNFQTYPALQSVTPPEIVNEAHKNNQAFYSLSNEIANFKARNQSGFQPPLQQHPQMMVNPAFGGGYPSQQNYPQPQQFTNPYQGNAPLSGNSGLFNKSSTPQGMPIMQQPKSSSGKYDYLKPSVPQGQKSIYVTENVTHIKAEPGTSTAYFQPEKELVWSPSIYQFYPLTINPFKEKLLLREVANPVSCKMAVISYIEPLKGPELDREKHKITTMSQIYTAHIPDNYGTRAESLKDSVSKLFAIEPDEINNLKKANEEERDEFEHVLTHIEPSWVFDSFIENAIFSSRLTQREHILNGTECTVYRTYRIISKPIISLVDHSDFIDDISTCKTFNDVAVLLHDAISFRNNDTSLVTLCYEIDKLLKKEINHVLTNKMSLNGISIDSFIDDVKDLPDYLNNAYGDKYEQTFVDFQRAYIPRMISTLRPDEVENFRESLMDDRDLESKVVINFINQTYSLTFVNVENFELEIKPFDDCASSIIEEHQPLMYKIVSGIFTQDRDTDRECLHNLIITADDVIYEVQKGLIGNNFFTINKFNK